MNAHIENSNLPEASLVELVEQLDAIRAQLSRIKPGDAFDPIGFPNKPDVSPSDERNSILPLPDPNFVRKIIRNRQMRNKFFSEHLFADPAWDMLLDLTAAQAEHSRVSVTSLCIASNVPPTTALRWISQMISEGLFIRVNDQTDRRRAFVVLSENGAKAMANYFAALKKSAAII